MADKVTIELEVLAKEALASVATFAKQTQEKLESINFRTGISAISDGLNILKTLGNAAGAFFEKANAEALEAETSIRKLNNAMRLTGEFSQFASKRALEYAENLSSVTAFTDDQVVSALALSKNYGLVNSESRKTVSAAADLAEITGSDLNTAVQKLAATYNGFLNKELVKIAPELRGLTSEQLAAGAAVDILANKLQGSAVAALNSYGGSLITARKEVDNFYEAVGSVTLRVTAFLIRDTIALKNRILELAAAIKADSTIGETIFDQASKAIRAVPQKNEEDRAEKKAKEDAELARKTLQFRENAEAEFQKVRVELERAGLSEIEKINLDAANKIKVIKNASLAGNITAIENQEKLIAGIRIEQAKKTAAEINRIENDRVAKAAKERTQVEQFSNNAGAGIGAVATGQAQLNEKTGIAIGAGLVQAIAKGAAGAKELVSSTIGAIADAYLPGIGAAVKGIIDFLSQGPEEVRKTVSAFVKEIPKTFKAILISLPELMIGLFEGFPDLIAGFIEAIPKVIEAIIRAFPRLYTAIFQLWVKGIPLIIREFILKIPQIIKGFVIAIIDGAKQFINTIVDGIKEFFGGIGGDSKAGKAEGIPVVGGIVGAVGNFFGGVGDFLGLAEGGRIPDLPRYEGDRFPAKLNAGEQVFSKDLSNKLEQFLSGQSSQPIQVTLNVGQSELARVMFDLNRNGFRTA